jgi:chromosome segregation ATPase
VKKIKNLEKTIEGLRLTLSSNSGVNITDLENKIKHYQDENIRIGSELVESDKRFAVTKESLSALQNQRSDLIEKLNSINHVIKG